MKVLDMTSPIGLDSIYTDVNILNLGLFLWMERCHCLNWDKKPLHPRRWMGLWTID